LITQTMSLIEMHPGQSATIVRVGGMASLRRRFAEMGIVAGEVIRVDRIAPLGDPVAYRIKGYRLSLRREEASQIEVSLAGSENHA
jgi:Fe2+ transport system protein FeoA